MNEFVKKGNRWLLLIDDAILESLNVDPKKDFVEFTLENDALLVAKSIKQEEI